MRIVFAGTPDPAVPSLQALIDSDHEVVAVITRPDAPAGRGRRLIASPVAECAEQAGIPVLKPEKVRDPEFLETLRALEPDCCPIVAYGALIPKVALDIPRLGWINLHFSLLPAWRGAAPVQHALIAGDDVTGAATFQLEEGLDTGPVFGVVTESIGRSDTSGDLLGRLAVSGAQLLVATLDGMALGKLEARVQPSDGISLAPKLTVPDAQIDFAAPAARVDRLVRGCTPAPGAWCLFRGERLKVGPVVPVADVEALAPGRLRVDRTGVFVGTATHPIRLGVVQPPGKKPMPAGDWARGVRLTDNEVLS